MKQDRNLRRASLFLSVIGLLDSLYLIYIKINPASLLCSAAGGCEAVNTSVYSTFHGIPIAVFGALAYAAILALLLLESRQTRFEEWAPIITFGLSLAGMLYSAYLTYIEIAVLHQICPYCVTSAIAITLIFILSIIRLIRGQEEQPAD